MPLIVEKLRAIQLNSDFWTECPKVQNLQLNMEPLTSGHCVQKCPPITFIISVNIFAILIITIMPPIKPPIIQLNANTPMLPDTVRASHQYPVKEIIKPFCFAAYRITGNHPECQNNRRNHYLKQYLFHAILLHTYRAVPPADNNDLS